MTEGAEGASGSGSIGGTATPGRPLPATVPSPPHPPLIAPTGSPGLNAVLDVVNSTVAPFTNAPPPGAGTAHAVSQVVAGVMGVIGAPAKIIDTAFAALTAPIAAMFPSMPAVTLLGMHVGVPHAHTHPPSLIPPAPPVPLPSIGMLVGSGAVTVMIGGMPAARAGDIGISVTCGSLAPPFEVFTGSSNVFIGGARAARILDITKHCNPTSMGPFAIAMGVAGAVTGAMAANSVFMAAQVAADAAVLALKLLCGKDPGIPPGMGTLIGPPVPNVLIGGFPCPPVGQMAVGALLKALSSAAKALKGGASSEENGVCANGSHPIYLVTGENFDVFVDFVSGGLFEWRRRYTSGRARDDSPLGHGFRHLYQRSLSLRLHKATFTNWHGETVEFPRFEPGSNDTRAGGYVLTRLARGHLKLTRRGEPDMQFQGNEFGGALALSKVSNSEYEVAFAYDHVGRLAAALQTERASGTQRRFELRYDDRSHITHLLEMVQQGAQLAPLERAAYSCPDRDLLAARDALGGVWHYEYDSFHRLTKSTDPRSYSYSFKYDALGRCVEATGMDGLWACKVEYFPEDKYTRYTEGENATWEFHYDGDGVTKKIVDPYGGVKTRERNGEGRMGREVDSGGREMRWLYDADGAHFARLDRFGNFYPPEVEMPKLPNPLRRQLPSTSLGWVFGDQFVPTPAAMLGADPASLNQVPLELQAQARLSFRVQTQTRGAWEGPPDLRPKITRDVMGRKTREVDAVGRARQWDYDATGNLINERDRDGRSRTRSTTSWNLTGARQDALGNTTRYEYSRLEKVVGINDSLGNVSRYDYDLKERLVRVHRHDRVREEYVYDGGDHLIKKLDGTGNVLFENEIHDNHLVARRTLASGGFHKFDYDHRGRVTEASTDAHEVRLAYNGRGAPVADLRDDAGIVHLLNGDNASTQVLGRFTLKRALANGVLNLTDPAGRRTTVDYEPTGLVRRTCSNGTIELLQYDEAGRLQGRLTYARDALGRVRSWSNCYKYSAEGDLLQVDDSVRGTTQYELDAAHRLAAEVTPRGSRIEYRQDAAYNVLSTAQLGGARFGTGNRLVATDAEAFRYSERDQLIERRRLDGSSIRYTYDSFEMLKKIEPFATDGSALPVWDAAYDALGRRIRSQVGDARREFYWDGDRIGAEIFPDGHLRIYHYASRAALTPLGFTEYEKPSSDAELGKSHHVFSSPVGMPLCIEDEHGAVVWSANRADPFGVIDVEPNAQLEYNLRWPGHYFDPETGLHYNRYRYYAPRLARYLQSDPIGYGGSPVNLYAYVPNPLVQVDVLGLEHEGKAGSGEEGENEGAEQAPKPTSEDDAPSLTPHELAAADGNSPEQQAARRAIAEDFYRSKCPGMTDSQIESHVRCIDTSEPVQIVSIPPGGGGPNGDQMHSWVAPGQGAPGQYFSPDPATTPEQLGVSPRAIAPADGDTPPRIAPREQRTYTADPAQPATGLQSTAAPADDTWSVPGGRSSTEQGDLPTHTGGGGNQIMVPRGEQGGFSRPGS